MRFATASPKLLKPPLHTFKIHSMIPKNGSTKMLQINWMMALSKPMTVLLMIAASTRTAPQMMPVADVLAPVTLFTAATTA